MEHLAWNIVTHLIIFAVGVLLSSNVKKAFKKIF